jgi:hypothetical protein
LHVGLQYKNLETAQHREDKRYGWTEWHIKWMKLKITEKPKLTNCVCYLITMLSITKIMHCWWWINERVWNTEEMIETQEQWSTWGKTLPSTTLSTTNPPCTGPGLNPGLCINSLATNHWSHGKAPNSQTAYLISMISLYSPHSSPLFCYLNLVAWMTDCLKDKYLQQLQIMENKNILAAVYFHARSLDMLYVTHKHLSCWFLQPANLLQTMFCKIQRMKWLINQSSLLTPVVCQFSLHDSSKCPSQQSTVPLIHRVTGARVLTPTCR